MFIGKLADCLVMQESRAGGLEVVHNDALRIVQQGDIGHGGALRIVQQEVVGHSDALHIVQQEVVGHSDALRIVQHEQEDAGSQPLHLTPLLPQ